MDGGSGHGGSWLGQPKRTTTVGAVPRVTGAGSEVVKLGRERDVCGVLRAKLYFCAT